MDRMVTLSNINIDINSFHKSIQIGLMKYYSRKLKINEVNIENMSILQIEDYVKELKFFYKKTTK